MDNNFNDYNEVQKNDYTNTEPNTGYGNYSMNMGNDTENSNKPDKKKKTPVLFYICLLLLIAFGAGTGVYFGNILSKKPTQIAVQKAEEKPKEKITLKTTSDNTPISKVSNADVSGVVENVMPSIVSINNVYEQISTDFFGQSFRSKAGGSGSGIIIGQNNSEVLVVTNNHVSAAKRGSRNQKITLTFVDGKTALATIKGADASSDLAVLSVKMSDINKDTLSKIKIATVGDSTKLKVGQMAIAIGNALGYGQSTTVGYISALNREVAAEDFTMKLIQTDAAINPGNSGGALLNAKGEVIGINSIKYASNSVEGMGFSIPISTAIPIINDLMNREEIKENEQSYLGIMGQDVTEGHNKIYGMPIGVYVTKVTDGSPAARAGLKMGNIITGFNGTKIRTMSELQSKLASVKAGTPIKLTVNQYVDGKYVEREINVVLGNRTEIKDKFNANGNGQGESSEKSENGNNEDDDNIPERQPSEGSEGSVDPFETPFEYFFNR